MDNHLRFHEAHAHLAAPFGSSRFGQRAEAFARFFGTPNFLVWQTFFMVLWIGGNTLGFLKLDLYPFIFLNLLFSIQAAYAAPLILLAQTRQADRDKANMEADAKHREDIARQHQALLTEVHVLTLKVYELTEQIGRRK